MNRTRSETREAGSIADGAQRGNTGQRIHCKGDEQKNAIHFQVLYCGRGYYGGLPAIRAHKVAQAAPMRGTIPKGVRLINNHYQLIGVLKNDN